MLLTTALKIQEKAKTKNDGIYSLGGCLYRVKDGRATHYADPGIHTVKILMNCGNFDVALAELPRDAGWAVRAKKMLKDVK